MTADILKFELQPGRIVKRVEVRAYNMLDLGFDTWKFWLRIGGWI